MYSDSARSFVSCGAAGKFKLECPLIYRINVFNPFIGSSSTFNSAVLIPHMHSPESARLDDVSTS
jgi:hypothetical protein